MSLHSAWELLSAGDLDAAEAILRSLPATQAVYRAGCQIAIKRVFQAGINSSIATLEWLIAQPGYESSAFCMQFHPNGVQETVLDEIRNWCRKWISDLGNDFSTLNKNQIVNVIVFSDKNHPPLDTILNAISLFSISDFHLIFSLQQREDLMTIEFAEKVADNATGLVFLMQYVECSNFSDASRKIARDSITNIKKWAKHVIIPPDCHGSKDDWNAFLYYGVYRLEFDRSVFGVTSELLDHVRKFSAPAILPRAGDLRIALCISGQLRGFRKAAETWGVFDTLGADKFVHTWKKIGRRDPLYAQADRVFSGKFLRAYRKLLNVTGYDQIKIMLPNLFRLIADEGEITEQELKRVYNAKRVIIEQEPENWPNPKKMYYKQSAVQDMAEGYDVIIRVRPDKQILSASADELMICIEKSLKNRIVFSDFPPRFHFWVGYVVGDQVMMGSSSLLRTEVNVYREYLNLEKFPAYQISHEWSGHNNLANMLTAKNILVETIPIKWGDLLDSENINNLAVHESLIQDAALNNNREVHDLLLAAEADLTNDRR